jgi:tetratricopeptide (TPR) repeat protein
MPIEFRCKCGKLLCTDDDTVGRMAQCPQCGDRTQVPSPDVSGSASYSSSSEVVDSPVTFSLGRYLVKSFARTIVFLIIFAAIILIIAAFRYQRKPLHFDRPQDAITYYQSVLQNYPADFEAHNKLGYALFQMGRSQEAVEHSQQAIMLKPDYYEAYNNMGLALVQLDRPQEAIEYFQKALVLKPNYPEAHNNLGLALVKLDRPQEAVKHYQQALRLKSDYPEAYYNLALAQEKANNTTEAVAVARKALKFAKAKGQKALSKQIEEWLNSHVD